MPLENAVGRIGDEVCRGKVFRTEVFRGGVKRDGGKFLNTC